MFKLVYFRNNFNSIVDNTKILFCAVNEYFSAISVLRSCIEC